MSNITILHVDDEPDFADLTAEFLTRVNDRFSVLTETSTDDGVACLKQNTIDCIISDHDMPGKNGLKFLEEVREEYPNLPFILFTGKGSEEVASRAISAGVTDYLQKGGGTDQYTVLANRIENVVERNRAEQQLEESRARYRSLTEDVLDTSEVGTFILDENFDVVWINEAIETYFGLNRNEVIREHKPNLIETEIEPIIDNNKQFSETVLATYEDNSYTEEFECHILPGEDRAEYWLEHWSQPITSGFYNGGRIEHYTDITERKQREQDLMQYERRFEAIFEDPNLLVGLLDSDGTVLNINGTALDFIGADIEAVTGEPFWETPWWTDEIREDVQSWVEQAADGAYVDYKADLVRVDGQPYSVQGVVRPVTNEDDIVVSLVVSARDVSERRERERKLGRQNERLKEFSGFISHDLQTPLSVVRGRLELAIKTGEIEHVETALASLDRVDGMREDLAGVLETGIVVDETQELDLREIIDTVCNTIAAPEELSLATDGAPEINGDPAAVQRLLENLVNNSLEHGDSDVHICVGEIDGGFYFEDNGPGIDPAIRNDVFKPGFSTKEQTKGSGMGMASANQIVMAHGWEIDIKDAETLDGVRFEIYGGN